jgi:protein phosphatase 2C family protein 2/3
MDQDLLSHSSLGLVARGAGTTSNVLYFKGSKMYVACSGDSRAVMGRGKLGGKTEAIDLSVDHKPDLPLEKRRIEAAGGVVSLPGPRGLPPSRVWVNGRVGLAMSRSIGDGEAKTHGVVPNPEIKVFDLNPAQGKAEGDKFVIVASDGVWEFIESDEACQIVLKHRNATDACAALVHEAAARWKRFEGSYRDDITCIVTFLPFLEAGWADEEEDEPAPGQKDNDEADAGQVFINMGKAGISYGDNVDGSGRTEPSQSVDAEEEGGGDESGMTKEEAEAFAARRLSVHNPYDEDWNDGGEEDGDDDDPNASNK